MTPTAPTPPFDAKYSGLEQIEQAESQVCIATTPHLADKSSEQEYFKCPHRPIPSAATTYAN
jgi:hypothetical protein